VGWLLALFFSAAAWILFRCNTAWPPEVVAQSVLGSALQNGHAMDSGLTGRISGPTSFFIFFIPESLPYILASHCPVSDLVSPTTQGLSDLDGDRKGRGASMCRLRIVRSETKL
jgi:hypothetical protein